MLSDTISESLISCATNFSVKFSKDLDDALTQSEAPWKVVVGHHPISSGCEHGNTTELQQLLRPILEAYILAKTSSSLLVLPVDLDMLLVLGL